MKNNTNSKFFVGLILTLVLTLVIWSPPLQSAEHPEHPSATATMKSCQAMAAEKQKLMKDIQAQDAELAKQVARMNSAPANRKMDRMAALITRMVTQRTVMNVRQAKMQEGIMQHMIQHIQMGKESLAQCECVMTSTDPKPSGRKEHPDHPDHPKKK